MFIVNSTRFDVINRREYLWFSTFITIALLSHSILAQPTLSTPCTPGMSIPCRPQVMQKGIQKSPSVFYFQARVSPAKLPSGKGQVPIFVNLSRDGEVLCQESFSQDVKIRKGVLNLEIGRGMNCALDEVLTENSTLRVQLCLGSPDSCMRPIELTAVPFALSAHMASEVRQTHRTTLAARADVTHRMSADRDVLRPSAVGYGYFDFFTPSPTQLDNFDAIQTSIQDGFMLWTPVRGAEEGEIFPANQILFVGEDLQGELSTLGSTHLLASYTHITGRAQVLSGHAVVRGRSEIQGEMRIAQRMSAPKVNITEGGLTVIGDSVVMDDLSGTAGTSIIRNGATMRARVHTPVTQVRGMMKATQKSAKMGAFEAQGAVHVQVDHAVEVGGNLRIGGEAIEQLNIAPQRQGITVSQATHVGSGVTLYGSTTVTRRLNPDLPQSSGAQGISMQAQGGSPQRVFSTRENGVIELNRPADSTTAAIEAISIKANKVTFEGQASFQNGRLGSECEITEEGQKLVLKCGGKSLSFAADQCGNGRRFRCACGDGNTDSSEECDDGNQNNFDACLQTCTMARCGDRIVRQDLTDPSSQGYEECDDGNDNNLDACLDTCFVARCGDHFLREDLAPYQEGYEECDDGNDNESDTCTNSCTIARCGDGIQREDLAPHEEGYEECDDGNLDPSDACTHTCMIAQCGDGILKFDEECDDGNQNNRDGCDQNCIREICGNGVPQADEDCDDHNQDPHDACVNCRNAGCGDGYLWSGFEECDDGNVYEYDFCRSNCSLHCYQIDKVGHFVDESGSIVVRTTGRRTSSTSSGGGGSQAAVGITLNQRQTVIFESTNRNYDVFYHLRRNCDDVEDLAYDDDSGGNLHSRIEQTLDSGTYYLIVDGFAQDHGTSTLNVTMLGCSEIPIVEEINLVYGTHWGWFFFNGYAAGQLTVNTIGGEEVNTSYCGGSGPQKAIEFTLTRTSNVRFTTLSNIDSVLHIRSSASCHNPQDIICNDDQGFDLNSEIRTTLPAGTYYLIVDGYHGSAGSVTIDYEIY